MSRYFYSLHLLSHSHSWLPFSFSCYLSRCFSPLLEVTQRNLFLVLITRLWISVALFELSPSLYFLLILSFYQLFRLSALSLPVSNLIFQFLLISISLLITWKRAEKKKKSALLSNWIKLHASLELSPSHDSVPLCPIFLFHSYSLLILLFISLLGASPLLLSSPSLVSFVALSSLLAVISAFIRYLFFSFSQSPSVFPSKLKGREKKKETVRLRRNGRHRYYHCCKSCRVLGCSNWTPA